MLTIVDSGIDPIDSYSRWWRVLWKENDHNGRPEIHAQVILKCSIAHCCTLAAIQNVHVTYGTKDYVQFFKQLHEFLKDFESHQDKAIKSGLDVKSPLWATKTWVYFNSDKEKMEKIQEAIPSARIVHTFKNTAHLPYNDVYQLMFEV